MAACRCLAQYQVVNGFILVSQHSGFLERLPEPGLRLPIPSFAAPLDGEPMQPLPEATSLGGKKVTLPELRGCVLSRRRTSGIAAAARASSQAIRCTCRPSLGATSKSARHLDPARWAAWPVIGAVFCAAVHAAEIPYFPSASDLDREGFVRLINHAGQAGSVTVAATDDAGNQADPISLSVGAHAAVHFNSKDLEFGHAGKGVSGVGAGVGDWRLSISGDADIEALAYLRVRGGFLTAMLDVVPLIGGRYRIATFNPASNYRQRSLLRLVNNGREAARVSVEGIDGAGERGSVSLSIPAGVALTVDAVALEVGIAPGEWPQGTSIEGALGDGDGKWRLLVSSDPPLTVMNLMATPEGHVTSLSATPEHRWRGLVVAPESRCVGAAYDREGEYGGHGASQHEIAERFGGRLSPYSCMRFGPTDDVQIDHIVALAEAHRSGMCRRDEDDKRTFARDVLNLALAAPSVNSAKGAKDALDWLPERNRCWYANRVLEVKRKHRLSVDADEADAIEAVLSQCDGDVESTGLCAGE